MSKKTYTYCLFLKHPTTNDCKVHHVEVDSDGEHLSVNELLFKLSNFKDLESDYTLFGMNIINVKNEGENNDE